MSYDGNKEIFKYQEEGFIEGIKALIKRSDNSITLFKNHELYNMVKEFIEKELSSKEPRKFEFEAYLGEHHKDKIPIEKSSAIDMAFGYSCGTKLRTNKGSYEAYYEKISKWHIIMEEIIDENK